MNACGPRGQIKKLMLSALASLPAGWKLHSLAKSLLIVGLNMPFHNFVSRFSFGFSHLYTPAGTLWAQNCEYHIFYFMI